MISREWNQDKVYYLNGQTSWLVQGSEFKGERHVIRITDQGITSPPPVIRTYYLNIELVNNANTTVIIEFQGYASPIRLPYLGVARIYEIINAVNQPAGISYRVYEEGGNNATLLYLNGQQELTVTPSTKDEAYRIIITGVDGGQPNIKVYYLDLEFINEYGETVSASWTQDGQQITQHVPPKGEAFTEHAVTAFQAPSPVYIEAKINANNESVMVNGQLIFPVVYTEYLKKDVIRFGDGVIAGPSQVYYFNVEVTNLGSNDVEIKWAIDGQEQKQISRGGSVMVIASAMVLSVSPEPIWFTGYMNGQTVLLNNQPYVEVKPTTSKEVSKVQIGSLAPSTTPTPGGGGGGSGESRNYYIDATINNYGSDPLDIKYLIAQGGEQKVETAEAMTAVGINLTISATSQPAPISFQAFKQGTTEIVPMDGLQEVFVQPTLTISRRILNIGSSQRLWHFITTLVNQEEEPVVVTFNNGTVTNVTVDPLSQMVQYVQIPSVSQPPSYTITASSSTSQNSVLINGKPTFIAVGSQSPTPTTLILGELDHLRTYYISMQVNNNLDKNIDIKIRLHNGTEQTKTVAARTSMITDFLIQSRYQPDDIFVYGVLTGTTDIVYLNSKPELTIQPSIARHTHIINTGGDAGELKTYYLHLNVINGEPIIPDTQTVYTFTWPPTNGQQRVLFPDNSVFITHETQGTRLPDPITTVVTKSVVKINGGGGVTSQTYLFNFTEAQTNQTLVLGGNGGDSGGDGAKQTYHLNPIIQNIGSTAVTFRFPPPDGQQVTVEPGHSIYIPSTEDSTSVPTNMELTFKEADKTYKIVLEWQLSPVNVTINVGSGEAVIIPGGTPSTTQPPTTQMVTYHVDPTFINVGQSNVNFIIKVENGRSGTVTPNGVVGTSVIHTSSSPPEDAVIEFIQGSNSYTISLPWRQNQQTVYIKIGNGNAEITDENPTLTTASPTTTTTYYLKPVFTNIGVSQVSFKFPNMTGQQGQSIVLSPYNIAKFDLQMPAASLPPNMMITFTESSNTYSINLPWSQSSITTNVNVGSGNAQITDGSSTTTTQAPTTTTTYYLKPVFTNIGVSQVSFKFPNMTGQQGQSIVLSPYNKAQFDLQMPAASLPPNMMITFTEGSNTYSISLPWSQSSVTTNVNVGSGNAQITDGSSTTTTASPTTTTTYYLKPVFTNIGVSQVSFKFPNMTGQQGQSIVLSPYNKAQFDLQMPAASLPPNMMITFTEGSNTYSISLPWSQSSVTTNVNVGSGNAQITDGSSTTTTASPTTTTTYYLKPVFTNIGVSQVSFKFPNMTGQQGQSIVLSPYNKAEFDLQMPAASLPPNMMITFTEGSNTYSISLPWSQSSITTNVNVGSGKAEIPDGFSTTPTQPATQATQTYYLNPTLISAGSQNIDFTVQLTPTQSGQLKPGYRAALKLELPATSPPSNTEIEFTEAGNKYSIALPWTTSKTSNIYVNVGNGKAEITSGDTTSPPTTNTGSTSTYTIKPLIQNQGTTAVTFKFPPGNGQTITVPPFGTINGLQSTATATSQPPNMVLEFNEGSGASMKTYSASIPYNSQTVSVTVGNGEAVIGDSTPSTQPSVPSNSQPQLYYMNLMIKNVGGKAIEFNFTPQNNQLVQLPANSQANLTATMTSISNPKPVQLEIRETSGQVTDTFFVTVEWSLSEAAQTLNLGNGQGSVSTSGMSHNGNVPSNDAIINTPVELKTFYINFQFSNFDGKGTANVVIKHDDFPDKSVDVALNAVTGSMIQLTADAQPSPVKVTAKDIGTGNVILINGDQVHEVEFSDEPTPVYIALGDGATEVPSAHTGMAVTKDSQPLPESPQHTSMQQSSTSSSSSTMQQTPQQQATESHHTSSFPLFTSGVTSHNGSTVAHESPLKMYYISLEFDNQESNESAIIRWSLPDDFKDRDSEKEIPGMTIVTNEFVFGAVGVPAPIMFEAREKVTGRAVKLNGKYVLSVTPSVAKDTIKVQVTIPAEQEDSEKIYFVDVHLHNNEDYDINVQWSEADQQKEENIPAGGSIAHSVVLKAKRVPDPAIYTAYDPQTMEVVKLNGKQRLEVRPTLGHNWVTANAGNEQGRGALRHINLNIENDIPDHNVTVQWVENGQMKTIELTPGHSAVYQSQLLVSMLGFIRLQAFTDQYMPALVNGNLFFDLEPRDDEEFININITPKELKTSAPDESDFDQSASSSNQGSSSSNQGSSSSSQGLSSSPSSNQGSTSSSSSNQGSSSSSSSSQGSSNSNSSQNSSGSNQGTTNTSQTSPSQTSPPVTNTQQHVEPPEQHVEKAYVLYTLNPVFTNEGTKTVTFKFPPKDGQTVTLPPYAQAHMTMSQGGTNPPEDMIIQFKEGDSTFYNATLSWTTSPVNTSVLVGAGKAVIGDNSNTGSNSGTAPNTSGNQSGSGSKVTEPFVHEQNQQKPEPVKLWYLEPTFKNDGKEKVTFNFPPENPKAVELPPGGIMTVTNMQSAPKQPEPMTVKFKEANGQEYSTSLEWSDSKDAKTDVSIGKGKAIIEGNNGGPVTPLPNSGSDGSSSSGHAGSTTTNSTDPWGTAQSGVYGGHVSVTFTNEMEVPVYLTNDIPNGVNDTTKSRLIQPHSSVDVRLGVRMMDMIQPFTFKASDVNRKEQLHLNGRKEYLAYPMPSQGEPGQVKITSPTSKLYHVNLFVLNKAGQKVTVQVVWDEQVETLEINEGEAKNITKEIYTSPNQLPNYEFQIHEYGTDKNLLINGHPKFTLTPSDDAHAVTMIEITPSPESEGGKPQGQVTSAVTTWLVVLFDNQMDRKIKIVPSRSSVGSYHVDPHAFLQVNITIDSQNPFLPIFFKAMDSETQTKVLLNNSLSASLVPTINGTLKQNLTITPQALKVVPTHSYALLDVEDGLIHGNPVLTANGEIRESESNGLQLNGNNAYLSGEFKSGECILQPSNCPDGFTIALKVQLDSVPKTEARYIVDTGAHISASPGVSMYVKGNQLHYQLTAEDRTWSTSYNVSTGEIYYIIATWNQQKGVLLYFNHLLVATETEGTPISQGGNLPVERNPNFNIGRNVRGEAYAPISISSFTTFNTFIESENIMNVFLFFVTSEMAKGYYARMRVYNDMKRDALLVPNKGKPDGFTVRAGKKLEITLIDLSTDGKTVSPVLMSAYDKETGMRIGINNNGSVMTVQPTAEQNDYIDLVLLAPAPGPNPTIIWDTKTMKNKHISANPPLIAYGGVSATGEGIRMNGNDGYLDAGDSDGNCFTNLNLCEHGLTVTAKVKIAGSSLNSTTPRFVIDSGAHGGQGFSIYSQSGQLYGEVAQSGKMWRVSRDIPADQWVLATLTWSPQHGLFLYLNEMEHVQATVTTNVNNHDRSNRIMIGRSNTQDPANSFAEMTSRIFVLFDMFVTKSEATDIYVYYWGHATTISTDRFINVNVENSAGVTANLYPDKGEHMSTGYKIQPNMILELRLIEQGMQTDFPVTFRATKEDGSPLKLEGEETFVATPSEKANDAFLVKITQSLSCPEEDGVFADHADRYYFISCSQGIAQRKKCPPGTIFRKEGKECTKESGDSTKPSSRNSANVTFHNLAGKDIIISAKPDIENSTKEIELKAGSRATLKIDESSMDEPIIFTAKWMKDEKELFLNGNKTFKVKPQPQSSQVEIDVTDPDFYYNVTTYTAHGLSAGTEAKIYIKLFGVYGQTDEIHLAGNDEKFKEGETDKFQVRAGNIGSLLKINLRNDDSGESSDWHLDKVHVVDSLGNEYKFPANVWMSHEAGKQLEIMLTKDTGAADKAGGSLGAQQVKSARIEIHNSVFKKINLKVSTMEKPFTIGDSEDVTLTITTPSAENVNLSAVDLEGNPYYINGQLNYPVPVSEHGSPVKEIYISSKPTKPEGTSSTSSSTTSTNTHSGGTNTGSSSTQTVSNGGTSSTSTGSSSSVEGGQATSNSSNASTGGPVASQPETHFTVINKAGSTIKLVDNSGAWSMEFPPVESTEMLPQVAVTLKKQAVFKAYLVGTDGKQGDSLLINGEGQFVIEAGKAPETSLVVHKAGFDWKSALVTDNQKQFTFNAINQADGGAELKEMSGTGLNMNILKGGTVQGSISTTGLKDPLKYKAVGSNGNALKINGQETLTVETPASTDPTTLVIHNDGFDWKKSGTTMDTSKAYQFIVPNIADNDVTLSEFKGTNSRFDISKGDMRFQFTIPTDDSKDQRMFQFKAVDKSTAKDLLVNGQSAFVANPSIPLAPTTTLVIHKEGQEWENIRASYLGSGIASQGTGSSTSSTTTNSNNSGGSSTSTTSTGSTTSASTSTVNMVFSTRNVTEDKEVTIKEKGGAFANIDIPQKALKIDIGFSVASSVQSFDLEAKGSGENTMYYLNGQQNLKIDVKVPPSAIIVHERGFDWQKELAEIRRVSTSQR
uniref:Uncharacterized protein n=1 Tax=Clytia hemisphaerica TaxID=252671 RepID=A0A7M5VBW7_9CNID